jgi:3-oxoacyl-[acyl-carrier protein] reductase
MRWSRGQAVAIASRLLRDGWYVTGLDRTEPIINGPYFSPLMLDLSDADAVRCALCTLKVNDLVHAAGILRFGELGSLDFATGTDMWRVNVAAAMLLDDSGANASSRGRMVLIGSRTASGFAGRSQYVATKSALIGMARSWAMELAPRGHHRQCLISDCDENAYAARSGRSSFVSSSSDRAFCAAGRSCGGHRVSLVRSAAAITGQMVMCGRSSL